MCPTVFEKKIESTARDETAKKQSKLILQYFRASRRRGLVVGERSSSPGKIAAGTGRNDKKGLLLKTGGATSETIDAREYSPQLFAIHGSWPFDFYPDELIVEQKRVVINYHYFPFGTTTFTIPINKIGFFEVTHSLIFSSLHIRSEEIGSDINTTMKWLSHGEAQRAKDMVDGLRLKEADSLEVQQHDTDLLRRTMEALGR